MHYGEHLLFAWSHGIMCIVSGALLIIHGIIPSLFPKIGSRLIEILNYSFTNRRGFKNGTTISKNTDRVN
jgi:hypothetical protein